MHALNNVTLYAEIPYVYGISTIAKSALIFQFAFNSYEPFGLGRFATDHSLAKAASRPLFARVRRYAPQGDH